MRMSLFSKPTVPPAKRWLAFRRAAASLNVDEKTIKRWMKNQAIRQALGAVRHGQQWRIPLPYSTGGDSEWAWELRTLERLEKIRISIIPDWQREFHELEKRGKDSKSNILEANRVWLAARLQLAAQLNSTSRAIAEADKTATLLLHDATLEILKAMPKGAKVDNLKSQIPQQLKAGGCSDKKIDSIMSYWPEAIYVQLVHSLSTPKQMDEIRQGLDYMEATQICEKLNVKPTHENAMPLLHIDFAAHIHDTLRLPKNITVIINPTPELLENSTKLCSQGHWTAPPIFVAFQKDLSLRTVKGRYPQNQIRQKRIKAGVYGILDKAPGVDEKPFTGMKPVRDSSYTDKRQDDESN
jgi:hypothetical protein